MHIHICGVFVCKASMLDSLGRAYIIVWCSGIQVSYA